MPPPPILRTLVRTRANLIALAAVVAASLVAGLLAWWPAAGKTTVTAESAADATPAHTGPHTEDSALVEAERTGKDVAVETATDATTLTWAQPDGKLRSTISAAPVRARTAQGTWAPVDNTLRQDAKTGGPLSVRPVNVPVPVRFSAGSDAKDTAESVLAEVDVDGHTLTYTWPGALPKPVLDGARALYPEVLPGVDLMLVARDEGGFAQLLVVKDREAAKNEALTELSYGLRSKTAKFSHKADEQRVAVLDAKSGQEIASLPTPFAWDSAGKDPEDKNAKIRTATKTSADVLRLSGLTGIEPGARQAPMGIELSADGESDTRIRLDVAGSELLTDPATTFPVFVDPTLTSGWQAWTVAYRPYPNTSFFNGTNFNTGTSEARVGYESETRGTARSFWRMGVSTNIKGAKISSATFRVLNTHSWSCDKRTFELYGTGAISSGTTWNKQPAWETSLGSKEFAHGRPGTCPDAWVPWDVKKVVQSAADKGAGNITLGMRTTVAKENARDAYTWRKFKATSAELTIVYNRPPNMPVNRAMAPGGTCKPEPQGLTVAKGRLVVSATATDPDNNLKGLRFRFWKVGAPITGGTLVTNLSSGKATFPIESTSLADKTTYAWDVRSEDADGASSHYSEACIFTVDNSTPDTPIVTSPVWKPATPDGATWSTVRFGGTGPITFHSPGAAKFTYAFGGVFPMEIKATNGSATVPGLKPPHAGPQTLQVHAYSAVGNRSKPADHHFYVPPREAADGPGDITGDGISDILMIDEKGDLRSFPGDREGELNDSLAASYDNAGNQNPKGHWFDPATGKVALISHHSDTYPGDGQTDLFSRAPDGRFWVYPGDGYGSFNVDKRQEVRVPSQVPKPSEWTQILATGDIDGDKRPDLFLRTGKSLWMLHGYTGGAFKSATLMENTVWSSDLRELVSIADIDLDGTPDLLWRSPGSGKLYLRHGKPGKVAGSADIKSLSLAGESREGFDAQYGTNWTAANITGLISVPDLNGDRIPDLWIRSGPNKDIRVYHPSKTDTGGARRTVLTGDWSKVKAFG
ncbi:FG-GAP-like repeat-containing protein [Streptomyces sp. BI20]|uniref:FG-GAP-like repeat-containing protein n=1 Tax=Streptomyces sp. BI20 TaxID=3403460 RepID=UPI003C794173